MTVNERLLWRSLHCLAIKTESSKLEPLTIELPVDGPDSFEQSCSKKTKWSNLAIPSQGPSLLAGLYLAASTQPVNIGIYTH